MSGLLINEWPAEPPRVPFATGPSTPARRFEDAGGYRDQDARVKGGAVFTQADARGRLPSEKLSRHKHCRTNEEPLVHRGGVTYKECRVKVRLGADCTRLTKYHSLSGKRSSLSTL